MELIQFDKSKCTLCYACVRACPVRAIHVNNENNGVSIIHERCIGCGNCYTNCASKAILYYGSINETQALLAKYTCMAIVDPCIAAEFPDVTDYRNFVGMIKAIGFRYVCEISYGAGLVADEYKTHFENFRGKYHITSACTPVVEYVRKYQPGLIDSLIPVLTPMLATAKACRAIYGNDIRIIAITPCIGQKLEAHEFNGLVHSVLTFEELRELFSQKDIAENSVEFSEFDPPYGGKGSLFPISTGLLEAGNIATEAGVNRIITRDGPDEFRDNIDDFSRIAAVKHHLNAYFCKGCCTGPCTSAKRSYLQNHSLVVDFTMKRVAFCNENQPDTLANIQLNRSFTADDQRLPMPDPARVQEILKMLGRDMNDNHGCQSCGYKSCTEFAVHVAKGLAKPELCVTYTLRNSQEFIKQLTITNKKLAETQKALEISERKLRQDHSVVKETMNLLEAIMQKLPSGVVLADKNLKIIQSNEKFIQIIGREAEEINEIVPGLTGADLKTILPQSVYTLFGYVLGNNQPVENKDISYDDKLLNVSVFPIKKGEIAGAIFRDLYQPEVRREEVINRVNEVIEKNLQMVQQIGFLLGEGASETERMLNSIIESYQKSNRQP
ncbi:MAG: 4Fe-4S binding protein [Bacteroidales bacterium]|nr:4Fe-4S binding protein [Bacteroidales bacterium]